MEDKIAVDKRDELVTVDPTMLRDIIARLIADVLPEVIEREVTRAIRRARGKVD